VLSIGSLKNFQPSRSPARLSQLLSEARLADSPDGTGEQAAVRGLAIRSTVWRPLSDTAGTVRTLNQYADIEVHNWQFGGRSS
jgi:hypothetical protein